MTSFEQYTRVAKELGKISCTQGVTPAFHEKWGEYCSLARRLEKIPDPMLLKVPISCVTKYLERWALEGDAPREVWEKLWEYDRLNYGAEAYETVDLLRRVEMSPSDLGPSLTLLHALNIYGTEDQWLAGGYFNKPPWEGGTDFCTSDPPRYSTYDKRPIKAFVVPLLQHLIRVTREWPRVGFLDEGVGFLDEGWGRVDIPLPVTLYLQIYPLVEQAVLRLEFPSTQPVSGSHGDRYSRALLSRASRDLIDSKSNG